MLMVRRDFVAQYKQTILGPVWHFVNPVFTVLTYMLVFGSIAKIPTDGIPQPVFYMSGVVIWNYYATTLRAVSSTFVINAGIFGKVYFPRLVSPLSVVVSNLIRFGIQLFLLFGMVAWYKGQGQLDAMSWLDLLWMPLLLILVSGHALGVGIIISSLTTKYRDFNVFVGFGVGLLMYATPVVYPLSAIPEEYALWVKWNPLSMPVESFRLICTGAGFFEFSDLVYSSVIMGLLLFFGLLLFNRVEKTFMDTV